MTRGLTRPRACLETTSTEEFSPLSLNPRSPTGLCTTSDSLFFTYHLGNHNEQPHAVGAAQDDGAPATTAPATVSRHHDITCSDTRIAFSIPLQGRTAQTATLSDPRCRVDTAFGRLVGTVDLNACGTTVAFTNKSVIFRNIILLSATSNDTDNDAIPIECVYDRYDTVQLSYMPVVRHVIFTETGVGQLSFRIQQFSDATFSTALADSMYPLKVQADEDVYIQLSLGSGEAANVGDHIGLMVQDCVASPYSSLIQAQDNSVPLIRDSCPASPDVRMVSSVPDDMKQVRFTFRAVTFPDAHSGLVYVHCRVGLCPYQTCRPPAGSCPSYSGLHRARRAIVDDGPDAGTHQLSTGPFVVQASEGPSSATVMAAVSMVVAAMATAVAVVAIVAWRRSRRNGIQKY
ncbi:hypothetical protein BaRGS_00003558 [Batillaria attramentaria]|uniref:ZP domain-containing protein n=1 Tax=Batillaria attramentaria TaxID=370345 RepID=A0ABD0M265_9CAEN